MQLRDEQEKILEQIFQEKSLNSNWEVYRNMYYLRLRDSLFDDFSETEKFFPHDFPNWVDRFIYSIRSDSPDLAELSAKFPEFLSYILSDNKKYISEIAQREFLQLQSWLMWKHEVQPSERLDLNLNLKLAEHVILFESVYKINEEDKFLIYSSKDNMHWESLNDEELRFLKNLKQWIKLEDVEKLVTSPKMLEKLSGWVAKSLFSWDKN